MKRSKIIALAFIFVFAFVFSLSFSLTETLEAKASPCCALQCPPGCAGGPLQGKWHWKFPICVPAEYGHICWDPNNCYCY